MKTIRRKPLVRRTSKRTTYNELSDALDRLDKRAVAESVVPRLAEMKKDLRMRIGKNSWKDPEVAKLSIVFAEAMLSARRIPEQAYTFLVATAIEDLHEGRWLENSYPELREISEKIGGVSKAHGLSEDQYWPVGEGPQEYRDLNKQYDQAIENRFIETLIEFGLTNLAELVRTNPREFERRRERGRRYFFESENIVHAITDVVVRYEVEASRVATSGSYSAAVTLLGAALEGILVLRCLKSKSKAAEIASALPKKKRPRQTDDPTQWSLDVLIETSLSAGWLPSVETQLGVIRPEALAHILRQMRNYVHPGKVARERPWVESDENEYKDAEAIYTTLLATVSSASSRKKLAEIGKIPLLTEAEMLELGIGK